MGWARRWLKDLFGVKKKSERCERRRSGCGVAHSSTTIPPNISASEAAWLRSFYDEVEKERQTKHAVAVAAATAAAADAAVAAAKAAAAVVRLTNQGSVAGIDGKRESFAALRIQSAFRGYLARRALKALKGLVKLQAHVRGYLVRKQAKATLHSMQALFRAQASIISRRNRVEGGPRKSTERLKEKKRSSSSSSSGRLLADINAMEENAKIVEVDPSIYISTPKTRSRRNNLSSVSDICEELAFHGISSPVAASSFPVSRSFGAQMEWNMGDDDFKFSTAHSTPRFGSYLESQVSSKKNFRANTPQCIFPSYMANTQSSNARVRSHSAPKQRPEVRTRKKISLSDLMDSRKSLSGVRAQSSSYQFHEAFSFKNVVMGKLDERQSWSHNWG